jgi:hypothetical protein
MLIHYIFVIMLLLYLFLLLFILEDRSWSCARATLLKQRPIFCHAHVIHSSIFCLCSKVTEWSLTCWQIASRSYMSSYMAFSHKYGTVWYHPASSKLWHLTALPFVNFRKIDCHALESIRVLSQLCSACCVLSAGCGFCVNTLLLRRQRSKPLECWAC